MNSKSERNYGIDLLRIISMLAIVLLHVLGHGGILDTIGNKFGINYALAWVLEFIAYPAVNVFVLISGFVGYRNEKIYPNIKNLLSLYVQVILYGVVIALVLKAVSLETLGMSEVFKALLPITTGRYWFFSAYVIMFVFSPIINNFVHHTSRKDTLVALLVSVLFISCYSTLIFEFQNPFGLNFGLSCVWFLELYFIGAVIKKYGIHKIINKNRCIIVWLLSLLLMLIPKYMICYELGIVSKVLSKYNKAVFAYSSPLVLVMAVSLLCIFADIKIKRLKLMVKFLTPLCFGVYLIHDNMLVRKFFMSHLYEMIYTVADNAFAEIALIVVIAVVIFSICASIDYLRSLIFKICKIDSLCYCIGNTITLCLNRLCVKCKLLIKR